MSTLSFSSAALALILAVCGTSTAQSEQSHSNQTGAVNAPDSHPSGTPKPPALQERHTRYQVMPSDVLGVSFPLSPEINQSVTVQPDGYITLANVGSIYVQGETVPQIIDTLNQAYARILHNPIVAVDLTNFQHPSFVVTGQVGKPGRYELREDTTVAEGIAIGGGLLSASAKSQVFLLHRVSSDWMEVKKLDVKKVMTGKNLNEDIHLQPGDLIFVPDKFIAKFRRYVPYGGPGLGTGLGFSGTALLNGN